MGPPEAMLARRWWADALVNDGLFVRPDVMTKPNGFVARRAGKVHTMRKHRAFRLSVQVKIDLAACLRALVLLYLLT